MWQATGLSLLAFCYHKRAQTSAQSLTQIPYIYKVSVTILAFYALLGYFWQPIYYRKKS